jgi:putative transposase
LIRREKAFVIAYAVMRDHLHALLVPKEPWNISQVMRSLKGYASREINRRLGTSGSLWQQSYYDQVIRDEAQLAAAIEYIEANPVREGLVEEKASYRFSSARAGVLTDLGAWFES